MGMDNFGRDLARAMALGAIFLVVVGIVVGVLLTCLYTKVF